MENSVAKVYLLDAPYHIDKLYDYYIPDELRGLLKVGGFVAVPFGGGNRKQLALVGGLAGASEYTALKPVIAPVCDSIVLDGEMMGLCLYMKEHFLCTVGDAVRAILPSAALTKIKEIYSVTEKGINECDALPPKQAALLRYVMAKHRVDTEAAVKYCGQSAGATLVRLFNGGYLTRTTELNESRAPVIETVSVAPEYSEYSAERLCAQVRGSKQKEALSVLTVTGEMSVNELRDRYDVARSVIKPLVDKGILILKKEDSFRDPYKGRKGSEDKEFVLSDEQKKARDVIIGLIKSGEPKAALLHGVTGSGKTSVIREVMDYVVNSGRSVILLVPEIALTPQTVGIFRSHFGDKTVVVHSGLSKGERYDAFRKMRQGEAKVCIGTRSAVFAPFKDLGLIVMDEEQEHTYKSDMDPKYHARDIARYRCAKQNAVMLLASATPSVESYMRAEEGRYTLVELNERYGEATLPEAIITDVRPDARAGNTSPIGSELRARLGTVLEKGEQAILFINQRGYNRFLSCPLCGQTMMCPHCSVSYTFHTSQYGKGYLYCHYCGSKALPPEKCPSCGNESVKHVGYGTQLVEEELKRIFPSARVMRMDADTTSTKFSYDAILSSFRDGEADILIGTQMVTKGHDFPGVTLVGVINSDSSLYLSDYKANERTFALLTQVIGRAGRADKKGCALIQTSNPDHPVLKLSEAQDYRRMYKNEIALRRALVFPPYCDMVLFTLSSEAENEVMTAANGFAEAFKTLRDEKYPDASCVIFGPMEAPIYKMNGIYRIRVVIKCKMNALTRKLVSEAYSSLSRDVGRRIGISVDVNPTNL
jgi:primosomal protein N' (replication factor Y)